MEEREMIRKIVDDYARTGCMQNGEIKVIRVQDWRTTYVEPSGDGGRSVYMDKYEVDGKTYYAGYSSRSQTVYVSLAA